MEEKLYTAPPSKNNHRHSLGAFPSGCFCLHRAPWWVVMTEYTCGVFKDLLMRPAAAGQELVVARQSVWACSYR